METSLKEGENVEPPNGENVTNSVVGTENEDKETKENIEGSGTEKDTKEKKSKSKSPKTKDGTPKEPKKSTPKKKLPKLVNNLLKLLYIINLLYFLKCLYVLIQLRLNLNANCMFNLTYTDFVKNIECLPSSPLVLKLYLDTKCF